MIWLSGVVVSFWAPGVQHTMIKASYLILIEAFYGNKQSYQSVVESLIESLDSSPLWCWLNYD